MIRITLMKETHYILKRLAYSVDRFSKWKTSTLLKNVNNAQTSKFKPTIVSWLKFLSTYHKCKTCNYKKKTFSSSKRKLRLMISLFRLGFLAIQTRKTLPTIFYRQCFIWISYKICNQVSAHNCFSSPFY